MKSFADGGVIKMGWYLTCICPSFPWEEKKRKKGGGKKKKGNGRKEKLQQTKFF